MEEDRLSYYRTPSDESPLGFIPMQDSNAKILNKKKCLFEIYNSNEGFVQSHRTYLIIADSEDDMNQWLSVLQNRAKMDINNLPKSDGKDVIRSGWLNKRGGRRKTWKKRWFVLTETSMTLFYYRNEKVCNKKLEIYITSIFNKKKKKGENTFRYHSIWKTNCGTYINR